MDKEQLRCTDKR